MTIFIMSIILYKPHISNLFLFTFVIIFTTFTRYHRQYSIAVINSCKVFFERHFILTLHSHTLRISRKLWPFGISKEDLLSMPNRQYPISIGYPRTREFISFFITFSHFFFIIYTDIISSCSLYCCFFRYLTSAFYMHIFRKVAYKMQTINRSFFFVIDKLLSGSFITTTISSYPLT